MTHWPSISSISARTFSGTPFHPELQAELDFISDLPVPPVWLPDSVIETHRGLGHAARGAQHVVQLHLGPQGRHVGRLLRQFVDEVLDGDGGWGGQKGGGRWAWGGMVPPSPPKPPQSTGHAH